MEALLFICSNYEYLPYIPVTVKVITNIQSTIQLSSYVYNGTSSLYSYMRSMTKKNNSISQTQDIYEPNEDSLVLLNSGDWTNVYTHKDLYQRYC